MYAFILQGYTRSSYALTEIPVVVNPYWNVSIRIERV